MPGSAGVDRRIEGLEDKVSRQFVWTVGVQVTTFVAIVAALLSRGPRVIVLLPLSSAPRGL